MMFYYRFQMCQAYAVGKYALRLAIEAQSMGVWSAVKAAGLQILYPLHRLSSL